MNMFLLIAWIVAFALAVYFFFGNIQRDRHNAGLKLENEWLKLNGMRALMLNVHEFHATSGIEHLRARSSPALVDSKQRFTRVRLLKEEYDEYTQGELDGDMTQIADALADMTYIIVGTALIYGIPLDQVWNAVQQANMAKFVDGVRVREDGKILKPVGWKPPNISGILIQAGMNPQNGNCPECGTALNFGGVTFECPNCGWQSGQS